jgi:hypothetical protein
MTMLDRIRLSEVLRTAMEAAADPAMAAADWLARDIDPSRPSAIRLLTSPDTPLDFLRKAKDVYKTMRVLGETSSDRRVGARLYAAAIASALIHHGRRISRQSHAALSRAMLGLRDDKAMPAAMHTLAGMALCELAVPTHGAAARDAPP